MVAITGNFRERTNPAGLDCSSMCYMICSTLKTATVRTLRNDYAKLLRLVEHGEEIAISRRGRIIARLVPANPNTARIDWSSSAASRLPRPGKPMTAAASARVRSESQGDS